MIIGELVIEWAEQPWGNAPTGTWTTFDATTATRVWQTSNGGNRWEYKTFQEWQSAMGFRPTDGLEFNANSKVIGVTVAFGTWNGTGEYFVDNLAVGFSGSGGVGTAHLYSFG